MTEHDDFIIERTRRKDSLDDKFWHLIEGIDNENTELERVVKLLATMERRVDLLGSAVVELQQNSQRMRKRFMDLALRVDTLERR